MPDITNNELKRLIQRIMIKVNTIEEKLDLLLEEREARIEHVSSDEEEKDIDSTFNYTPIHDDIDLANVSKKISLDKDFKNNLRYLMTEKEDFNLKDLFSVDFLLKSNVSGKHGKRNLEALVPYNEIYLYVHIHSGKTQEQIKQLSITQLTRLQNQFGKKSSSKHISETIDPLEDENLTNETVFEIIPHEDLHEIKNETEETHQTDTETEENDLSQRDEHTYSMTKDKKLHFFPIKNDQELQEVSQKIKNDPVYLKLLRLQMVEESNNGDCRLEQLFTAEFLKKCNIGGLLDCKNLSEFVPYKAIYVYVKRHLGHTLPKIEEDARNEIKRIKNRLRNRVYAKKEREKRQMFYQRPNSDENS